MNEKFCNKDANQDNRYLLCLKIFQKKKKIIFFKAYMYGVCECKNHCMATEASKSFTCSWKPLTKR